jgi:site-specific recombinase XerD
MDAPLFTSSQGSGEKPLAKETVNQIFKRYAKKAGLPADVSPHSARATAVSNALENGATVLQVQYMGGWSNMNMVLRYDRRRQEIKNSAVWKVKYK